MRRGISATNTYARASPPARLSHPLLPRTAAPSSRALAVCAPIEPPRAPDAQHLADQHASFAREACTVQFQLTATRPQAVALPCETPLVRASSSLQPCLAPTLLLSCREPPSSPHRCRCSPKSCQPKPCPSRRARITSARARPRPWASRSARRSLQGPHLAARRKRLGTAGARGGGGGDAAPIGAGGERVASRYRFKLRGSAKDQGINRLQELT